MKAPKIPAHPVVCSILPHDLQADNQEYVVQATCASTRREYRPRRRTTSFPMMASEPWLMTTSRAPRKDRHQCHLSKQACAVRARRYRRDARHNWLPQPRAVRHRRDGQSCELPTRLLRPMPVAPMRMSPRHSAALAAADARHDRRTVPERSCQSGSSAWPDRHRRPHPNEPLDAYAGCAPDDGRRRQQEIQARSCRFIH